MINCLQSIAFSAVVDHLGIFTVEWCKSSSFVACSHQSAVVLWAEFLTETSLIHFALNLIDNFFYIFLFVFLIFNLSFAVLELWYRDNNTLAYYQRFPHEVPEQKQIKKIPQNILFFILISFYVSLNICSCCFSYLKNK